MDSQGDLSADELAVIKTAFAKTPTMTQAQFGLVYRNISDKLDDEYIDTLFRLVDADEDGLVSWDDFQAYLNENIDVNAQSAVATGALFLDDCKTHPHAPKQLFHASRIVRLFELRRPSRYFTCSEDGTVRMWNTSTLEFEGTLHNGSCSCIDVCFDESADLMWLLTSDQVVSVYQASTAKVKRTMKAGAVGPANGPLKGKTEVWRPQFKVPKPSAKMTLQGKPVDVGGTLLKYWNAKHGKLLQRVWAHTKKLESFVGLWLPGQTCDMYSIVATMDGEDQVFYIGAEDGTVSAYRMTHHVLVDESSATHLTPTHVWRQHTDRVTCLRLDKELDLLFSSGADSNIHILNLDRGGVLMRTLRGTPTETALSHTRGVAYFEYNPKVKLLGSWGNERHAVLWDPIVGKPLTSLGGHNSRVIGMQFGEDNINLFTYSLDKVVRIWDTRTFRCLQQIKERSWESLGGAGAMLYDQRRQTIVTATSRLYTRGRVPSLFPDNYRGHTTPVVAVMYNDAYQVICSCDELSTRVWSAPSRSLSLLWETQRLVSASLDTNGRRVLVDTQDELKVCALSSGHVLLRLKGVERDPKLVVRTMHCPTDPPMWVVGTGKSLYFYIDNPDESVTLDLYPFVMHTSGSFVTPISALSYVAGKLLIGFSSGDIVLVLLRYIRHDFNPKTYKVKRGMHRYVSALLGPLHEDARQSIHDATSAAAKRILRVKEQRRQGIDPDDAMQIHMHRIEQQKVVTTERRQRASSPLHGERSTKGESNISHTTRLDLSDFAERTEAFAVVNDRYVVQSNGSGVLRLWDCILGKCHLEWDSVYRPQTAIFAMDYAPKKQLLLTGDDIGYIGGFDISAVVALAPDERPDESAVQRNFNFRVAETCVSSLRWMESSGLLAAGCYDNSLLLVNLKGERVAVLGVEDPAALHATIPDSPFVAFAIRKQRMEWILQHIEERPMSAQELLMKAKMEEFVWGVCDSAEHYNYIRESLLSVLDEMSPKDPSMEREVLLQISDEDSRYRLPLRQKAEDVRQLLGNKKAGALPHVTDRGGSAALTRPTTGKESVTATTRPGTGATEGSGTGPVAVLPPLRTASAATTKRRSITTASSNMSISSPREEPGTEGMSRVAAAKEVVATEVIMALDVESKPNPLLESWRVANVALQAPRRRQIFRRCIVSHSRLLQSLQVHHPVELSASPRTLKVLADHTHLMTKNRETTFFQSEKDKDFNRRASTMHASGSPMHQLMGGNQLGLDDTESSRNATFVTTLGDMEEINIVDPTQLVTGVFAEASERFDLIGDVDPDLVAVQPRYPTALSNRSEVGGEAAVVVPEVTAQERVNNTLEDGEAAVVDGRGSEAAGVGTVLAEEDAARTALMQRWFNEFQPVLVPTFFATIQHGNYLADLYFEEATLRRLITASRNAFIGTLEIINDVEPHQRYLVSDEEFDARGGIEDEFEEAGLQAMAVSEKRGLIKYLYTDDVPINKYVSKTRVHRGRVRKSHNGRSKSLVVRQRTDMPPPRRCSSRPPRITPTMPTLRRSTSGSEVVYTGADSYFWDARFQELLSATCVIERQYEHRKNAIRNLVLHFNSICREVVELVVQEWNVPQRKRKVKNVAGGLYHWMYRDVSVRCVTTPQSAAAYGSFATAAKIASCELRAANAFLEAQERLPGRIHLPLQCVVEYYGLVFFCSARVPFPSNSFVFGCPRYGEAGKRGDSFLRLALKQACTDLHLRGRDWDGGLGCYGMRGYEPEESNRVYITGLSRLYPLHVTGPTTNVGHVLRPELLRASVSCVSSESHRPEIPWRERVVADRENTKTAKKLTHTLMPQIVNHFMRDVVHSESVLNGRIVDILHKRGINVRFILAIGFAMDKEKRFGTISKGSQHVTAVKGGFRLGKLSGTGVVNRSNETLVDNSKVDSDILRVLCFEEAVARTFAVILRDKVREVQFGFQPVNDESGNGQGVLKNNSMKMNQFGITLNISFGYTMAASTTWQEAATELLSMLCEGGELSKNFWDAYITPLMLSKFYVHEYQRKVTLDDVNPTRLFTRACQIVGLEYSTGDDGIVRISKMVPVCKGLAAADTFTFDNSWALSHKAPIAAMDKLCVKMLRNNEKRFGLWSPDDLKWYRRILRFAVKVPERMQTLNTPTANATRICGAVYGRRNNATAAEITLLSGMYLFKQGKHRLAVAAFTEVHHALAQWVRPSHPLCTYCLDTVGIFLAELGQWKDSTGPRAESLALKRQEVSNDGLFHVLDVADGLMDLTESMLNISTDLRAMQSAREHLLERYEILSSVFEQQSLPALRALIDVANAHYTLDEIAESLELFRNIVERLQLILGTSHKDVAAAYDHLGRVHLKANEYEEALAAHSRSEIIRHHIHGSNAPEIAISLTLSARVYLTQGFLTDAARLLDKALRLEETWGYEHVEVQKTLEVYADLYRSKDELDRAIDMQQRVLDARERTVGPLHPITADSMFQIASLFFAQDRFGEAWHCYNVCYMIREKALGAYHPLVASSIIALAQCEGVMGKVTASMQHFKQALGILDFCENTSRGVGSMTSPNASMVDSIASSGSEAKGNRAFGIERSQLFTSMATMLQVEARSHQDGAVMDLRRMKSMGINAEEELLQATAYLQSALQINVLLQADKNHPSVVVTQTLIQKCRAQLKEIESDRQGHLRGIERDKMLAAWSQGPDTSSVRNALWYRNAHRVHKLRTTIGGEGPVGSSLPNTSGNAAKQT